MLTQIQETKPAVDMPRMLAPLTDELWRYKVVYGGRGKGASWGFARALLRLGQAQPERILCTREIQRTIKDSVHYLLRRQIEVLDMGNFYKVTDKSITGINGTEFIFAGLREMDANKLKSLEGCTRCWVAEAHVISENSWQILLPTIREPGSEIWIEFNPELDTDPTYVRFVENERKNSKVIFMSYADNPWFPDVLEDERQTDYALDKEPGKPTYNHIWEGKCRPTVKGAIFANEVAKLFEDGHVRPLDYESTGRVHVIMDLGYGVMSAILAQKFASTVQIIGYIELRHKTYHDLTLMLKDRPYQWGKVFMPHDGSHKDPKYGKSHYQVMEELGWEVEKIPQIGIENYISEGRDMFQNVYISDNDECKQLIHCLRRFKRAVPSTTDHPGLPLKDEWSHGSEAFCYTAVVADELVNDDMTMDNPYSGFASGYAA